MKLTQWLVGLAAVAAALLVWVFASKHRLEPERAHPPAEAARATEGTPETTDALEAEEHGTRSWVSVSGRLTLPPGDLTKWHLQVHIGGGNDLDWAFESTGGDVDPLGNFAVGSQYLGEGPPRDATLDVYTHDGFSRSRELQPREFVLDAETESWEATVQLEPNWIVVRGQLVDDNGQPVSGCKVLVMDGAIDREDPNCFARRETELDGRFELLLASCGAFLDLTIKHASFVPIDRRIDVARGPVHDLGVVQLSRGLSISGHVKSSFPPQARVREFEVWLTHPAKDERDSKTGAIFSVEETELVAEVPVAEDGSFQLTGLTPGDYTIRPRRNRELLGARHKRKAPGVAAPASDLVLVDDGAIVRMQARDRATGQAIPGHMRVKFNGRWCWPTDGWPVADDDGPLNLNCDCGVAVEGVARMGGYRDTPIAFTTPGEGELLEYEVLFDALPPEDEKR
jgi:hypothetical protein